MCRFRKKKEEHVQGRENGYNSAMQDSFGRNITYLRVSVTDRCNYRCRYCMPARGVPVLSHEDICSFEELAAMVRMAVSLGVRKVRITGGEPLVRSGVVAFAAEVASLPGVEDVSLTTNGSLLAGCAKDLRRAGVGRLNISLDTLDAATFARVTGGGRIGDVLEGIRAAREAGFSRIKLNTVLMKGINDREVPDLVRFAGEEGLMLRFIELMPIGSCAAFSRAHYLPAEYVLEACPDLHKAGSDGVSETYVGADGKARVGLIHPISCRFCDVCNRIRITSRGCLKPCLHSADEVVLRGLEGEALRAAIARGIALKPRSHEIDATHASRSVENMFQIGG